MPIKFHGSIKEYRIPWICGIICLAVYKFLQQGFYHLYIYFFIISVITIYIQWLGWGEIQSHGLIVRYGIFHNFKLLIKWNQLNCVKTVYRTHNYIPLGGYGAMYDSKGFNIPYIGFEFKSVVPEEFTSLVKKGQYKMLFGQTIDLLNSNTLILIEEPSCGLKFFYKQISEFVNVKNIDLKDDNPMDYKKWWSLNWIDLAITLIPCVIIYLSN